MNEIKKCPFCGGEVEPVMMDHGLSSRGYDARFSIICNSCGFRFGNEISRYRANANGQIETIEDGVSRLIEQWNKRAEEPRKESNIEWALKKIEKGDFYFSICEIANYIKNGKPCAECDECEFQDDEDAINYLLAPHEGKDDFVAVSDLISKTQSSANEILEALRANAKEEK